METTNPAARINSHKPILQLGLLHTGGSFQQDTEIDAFSKSSDVFHESLAELATVSE